VRALAPLLLLLLSGCSSIPLIAGVIGGGAAGGASANPAVGFAVGVGVDAAASVAVRWYGRSRQRAEQDAIAAAAGPLAPGERAPWHINHFVPLGDEHGELQVVREIPSPLSECREIAFSVIESKPPPHWYITTICREQTTWRWAAAEPAVERWGYLQ
jgi:hypothetical protein